MAEGRRVTQRLREPANAEEVGQLLARLRDERVERVRVAWCDLHGVFRGKTLMPHAVADALAQGVSMVSTLMLKDTSDRTAYKVFEPGELADLEGFGFANNLLLRPEPASFRVLPSCANSRASCGACHAGAASDAGGI